GVVPRPVTLAAAIAWAGVSPCDIAIRTHSTSSSDTRKVKTAAFFASRRTASCMRPRNEVEAYMACLFLRREVDVHGELHFHLPGFVRPIAAFELQLLDAGEPLHQFGL